jgi:hypothetical protein
MPNHSSKCPHRSSWFAQVNWSRFQTWPTSQKEYLFLQSFGEIICLLDFISTVEILNYLRIEVELFLLITLKILYVLRFAWVPSVDGFVSCSYRRDYIAFQIVDSIYALGKWVLPCPRTTS